ncbi:MAG: dihydropteroate synthase [Kiritimatiellaeota bacterium]|nr:dihydropteroate synthase [Kiritimatiellota bacterium]
MRTEKIWQCRDRRIDLSRPHVMGIVNVTPDSFSDGGQWPDAERAVAYGLTLAADGADILDIGGVSTRPGAGTVSEAEELRRVLPVVQGLVGQTQVVLSVDTSRANVARAAIKSGASIVNDVMRFDGDDAMAAVVRETGAGIVLTHSRPSHDDTDYADVAAEVQTTLENALAYAQGQGIAEAACVIDPGLGFAKTTAHNVAILKRLDCLVEIAPVLIGASRKRFVRELGVGSEELGVGGEGGSIAVAVWSVLHGAAIVRAHDVKGTAEALRVIGALRG